MSLTYGLDRRDRWAARSIVVTRWTTERVIAEGDLICELEVDGVPVEERRPVHGVDERWGLYGFYVREGHEVGPSGDLFAYTYRGRPANILSRHAEQRLVRRDGYPRIFLSYRRDDSEATTARLDEVLAREFGRDAVFMDQFSIRPGEVSDWVIQQSVVHAEVVVALVGPNWVGAGGPDGERRLGQPTDLVTRELCAGLDRNTPVIPVLVDGARLPDTWLPEELWRLRDLQYFELGKPRNWDGDVREITSAVRSYLK